MSTNETTHGSRRSRYLTTCPRLLGNGLPRLQFGRGWDYLVLEMLAGIDRLLTDEEARAFEILQIKEKFGILRIYVCIHGVRPDPTWPGAGTPREGALRALIETAYEKSATTCEACGAPGEIRASRWLRVSCLACESRWTDAMQEDEE